MSHSHSPPVPQGNQSPFPRHEAPHAKGQSAPPAPPSDSPRVAKKAPAPTSRVPSGAIIGVLGLGAIAGIAGYLVAHREKSAPARTAKKRGRPKKKG